MNSHERRRNPVSMTIMNPRDVYWPSRRFERPVLKSSTRPTDLREFAKQQTYPFPKHALVFTCLQYKVFENDVGKGEIARIEQFLLFPQCFLPVWRTFFPFSHFN